MGPWTEADVYADILDPSTGTILKQSAQLEAEVEAGLIANGVSSALANRITAEGAKPLTDPRTTGRPLMKSTQIEKYVSVIRQFVEHRMGAEAFERAYLDLFKKETSTLSIVVFEPLDALFAAVDAFCPDPSLRSEDDLDEQQLRDAARATLTLLLAQELSLTRGLS